MAIVLGTGAVYYTYSEDWPFSRGLYLSVVTLTTVGCGDVVPQRARPTVYSDLRFFNVCICPDIEQSACPRGRPEDIRKDTLSGKPMTIDAAERLGDSAGRITRLDWLSTGSGGRDRRRR